MPLTDSHLPDADAREAALDPERSFIVQAPAGSGKTGLLIQRVLTLLATARQPEEIVAITFTRKAAGEMAERLLAELNAAAGEPPTESYKRQTWELARAALARDGEMGWNLRDNPGRLQVQTFDAFCLGLVRRLPFLSELGGGIGVAENAGELHREAAFRLLNRLEDPDHGPPVASLLAILDGSADQSANLLAEMLARRDQWLRHLHLSVDDDTLIEALADGVRRVVADTLADAQTAFSRWSGDLAPLLDYAAGGAPEGSVAAAIGTGFRFSANPDDLPRWRALADMLLTKNGSPRKTVSVADGFPAGPVGKEQKAGMVALLKELGAEPGLVAVLDEIRALPDPQAVAAHRESLLDLRRVLFTAAGELRGVFSERRTGDFAEVAAGARLALGPEDAPTDLALALDVAIRHILVDEFQDTSYGQFDLLTRLTAGWEPFDGRTLFLVGDPMQSIYRFRDAQVGLYLRARNWGVGSVPLEPLYLSTNFRSHAPVVAWVNTAFPHVMPKREDIARGAVTYEPSHAVHGDAPGAGVEVHALAGKDPQTEAAIAAAATAEALAETEQGKVAILVRARSHLTEILPALTEAGIAYRAVDIDPLADTPVVRDLVALTRALEHPADRIAWLAVLRAPWCGLTLADLLAVGGGEGTIGERLKTLPDGVSDDGRTRLQRVAPVLLEGLQRRGAGRLSGRVETAWVRLGGPACYDADSLRHADRFLALLDGLDDGGPPPTAAELEQAAADLYAESPAGARVEVMTVHKAKGLEWDTVILPGLGRQTQSDKPALLGWMERPVRGQEGVSDLILAPVGEASGEKDAVYQWVRRTEKERAHHETGRLLYVAATRAVRRLHLIGHATLKKEEWSADSRSLLSRLWPVVANAFYALEPPEAEPEAETARPEPLPIRRLPVDYRPPDPAPPVGEMLPAPAVDEYAPSFTWAGEQARAVGTVAHRGLQKIAADGLGRWNSERVRDSRPRWRAALSGLGMAPDELDNAAERVERVLIRTLSDERGRWLLTDHAGARSEYAVAGVVDGRVVHRVIDRVFVNPADGVRWIVDFKTGGHGGGQVEAFLDEEQRRYSPQLEEYARIVGEMEGEVNRPIRMGLYFPVLGGWREWG
ncbi:MAG: UvrD-helicase domain-containing protein [Nitrospirota bacterium]|nr:UvrD-helicase domain-containing protein [Nitrospirota bacterium]